MSSPVFYCHRQMSPSIQKSSRLKKKIFLYTCILPQIATKVQPFLSFLCGCIPPVYIHIYFLYAISCNPSEKKIPKRLLQLPSVIFSTLVEVNMSEKKDIVGRSICGRSIPFFLLSHGSSVPSGLCYYCYGDTLPAVLSKETQASWPPQVRKV